MVSQMEQSRKWGISGGTLKIIALVTMIIDHAAAVFIANGDWYMIGRGIGRLAFPIYCFLIVEGFFHTRNVKKYMARLFLFALVSEIPFDLAFYDTIFYKGHQNVFFTLFIGLITIWVSDYVLGQMRNKLSGKMSAAMLTVMNLIAVFVILLAGCVLAEAVFRCDYGASGICAIYIMYMFRNQRMSGFATAVCMLGVLSGSLEFLALFMLIPMHFYNGTRGKQHKYFFYAFYPVHLLILAIICQAIGLGVQL